MEFRLCSCYNKVNYDAWHVFKPLFLLLLLLLEKGHGGIQPRLKTQVHLTTNVQNSLHRRYSVALENLQVERGRLKNVQTTTLLQKKSLTEMVRQISL